MKFGNLYFLLLLLSSSTFLHSQEVITGSAFLALAKENVEVMAVEEKLLFLNNKDYELPIVQEVQLRTETHDFVLKEQEYTLRLGLNTKRQKEAYNDLHQSLIKSTEISKQLSIKEGLEEKYALLLDYHQLPLLLSLKNELKDILETKLRLLKAQVVTSDFDLDELIKTEEAIYEEEFDILNLEQKFSFTKTQIFESSEADSISIQLPELKDLREVYLNPKNSNYANTLLYASFQQEKERIAAEYNIEMAEVKNIIDFVQANIGPRDSRVFKEEFSVGVGLKLPIKGDKKLDLLELELEELEENSDYKFRQRESVKETTIYKERMEQIIVQYDLIKKQTENSQAKYVLERYQTMSDVDPMQVLKIREILLKKEISLQKLEFKGFESYLDWLNSSEVIIQFPLRNYLSVNLEEF